MSNSFYCCVPLITFTEMCMTAVGVETLILSVDDDASHAEKGDTIFITEYGEGPDTSVRQYWLAFKVESKTIPPDNSSLVLFGISYVACGGVN